MTYEEFIDQVQAKQRDYIAEERARMEKASELYRAFKRDMAAIGLHPLNLSEIEDRRRELDQMERDTPARHGDGPVMRWAYERECACSTF